MTPPARRPPAFNVPAIVLWMIAALAAVHALQTLILDPSTRYWLLETFAFIPGCYIDDEGACSSRAAGAGAWSPVTYAFLHGDWMHLGFNVVWLLAFGSPVATRLGSWRTLLFCAAGSMAGAAVFEIVNPTLLAPVIGASGVVSALMGGASRFALGAPARMRGGPERRPLAGITVALRDRTVLFFVLAFFLTNLIVGSGVGGFLGAEGAVAWEAHIGGFAFGFLFFGFFDPARRPARPGPFQA